MPSTSLVLRVLMAVDSSQTLDTEKFEFDTQGALEVLGRRKLVKTCRRFFEKIRPTVMIVKPH